MWRVLAVACALARTCDAACPGQNLKPNPRDPGERGPWRVGGRRLTNITEREFDVDVFFPGSGAAQGVYSYDLRVHTPPGVRSHLPDSICTPDSVCPSFPDRDDEGLAGVYEGLEIDSEHGPFPVVFYVHGTAGWGSASLHMQAHWASRGFVVVGIDYPGITLFDLLGVTELILPPPTDQAGDTRLMLAELRSMLNPQLEWLQGRLDLDRIGAVGHSAGGGATGGLGDIANVVIPMAGGAPSNDPHGDSALVLGAAARIRGYEDYEHEPKRLLIIEATGHQFCTDLCWIGREYDGIAQIAEDHGVWQAPLFRSLANGGCNFDGATRYLSPEAGWRLSNYVISGTLEETLMCDEDMTRALEVTGALPHAYDFREELPPLPADQRL